MHQDWTEEDILVTVRAYPKPSRKHVETSCVAGVTLDRKLRRLHPIPDRLLDRDNRFKKFDIARVSVQKSTDPRPESHRVNLDRPILVTRQIPSSLNGWVERTRLVEPFRASSMEILNELLRIGPIDKRQSLALVRPRKVSGFSIEPTGQDNWSETQKAKLAQDSFLLPARYQPIEYVPFRFRYQFNCDHPSCKGHNMSIIDWEVHQAYRKWRKHYPERWEDQMHQKFGSELPSRDLQFFVGTLMEHPKTWVIVGLFYPPYFQPTLL